MNLALVSFARHQQKKILFFICLWIFSDLQANENVYSDEHSEQITSIRAVYSDYGSVKTESFRPKERGGSTFMGLLGYLMGIAPIGEHEGSNAVRTMYHVFNSANQQIGLVHASSFEIKGTHTKVIAYYDISGKIIDIQVNGLPERIIAKLNQSSALKQFLGTSAKDYENMRLRRRRRQQGRMHTSLKKPSDKEIRPYFNKIFRSLQFNAGFTELSFFIQQFPDGMSFNKTVNEQITAQSHAVGGPELAFRETASTATE